MKTIILAGGFGTRLTERTDKKPKPMVEIGGRPILWHIMKSYAHHGFNEFIIAMGYKSDVIKRYFLEFADLSGNLTLAIKDGRSEVIQREQEEWILHLEDTGLLSNTGGRVKKLANWVKQDTFMVTYGDGVADVDINALVRFHKKHGKLATVTAVRPPARFGGLTINENYEVTKFAEKPQAGEGWINGGFLVFEPQVLELIADSKASLESDLLEYLSEQNELVAYQHHGFWQCMDTLRELRLLEHLWSTGDAPWKTWP